MTAASARRAARTSRAPRPGRLARLGPPASAGRWSLVAPLLAARPLGDGGRPRPGVATARAPRRRHPRGRARRRSRRRVRLGVRRAEGARGARPRPAWLLRVGVGRRPVRVAGRGRPAALRTRARARRSGARARRHRSGAAVRRHVAVAGGRSRRSAAARRAPHRRSSSRRAACRSSGSSAARTIWSRSRLPRPTRGGRRRWPTSCGAGAERSVEVRKVDGEPVSGEIADALRRAGFVDGYRGLVLRAA